MCFSFIVQLVLASVSNYHLYDKELKKFLLFSLTSAVYCLLLFFCLFLASKKNKSGKPSPFFSFFGLVGSSSPYAGRNMKSSGSNSPLSCWSSFVLHYTSEKISCLL